MKAIVDPNTCISCGLCISSVPEVFRGNDEGKAEAYGIVTNENQDAVQEAIDTCPVAAISWAEE